MFIIDMMSIMLTVQLKMMITTIMLLIIITIMLLIIFTIALLIITTIMLLMILTTLRPHLSPLPPGVRVGHPIGGQSKRLPLGHIHL